MKKELLTALFLCASMCLFAQVNRKHNAIRGGDEIIKQQVEYKDPGRSGENVIWNFSKLKPVNEEYKLTYSFPRLIEDSIYIMGKDTISKQEVSEGDLIIGKEHYTRYFYRIKDDTLLCLGHQNPLNRIYHKEPYVVMPYPFDYTQKASKDYSTEGLYSSKERISTTGNIRVECDAYGMMVLPSGDTLSHVLRIKTQQIIREADSIRLTQENPLNMEIESYRWYVKGYRYPVFETIRSFETSDTTRNETFNTAFFYPPQEHYYLADDPENLAIIDSLWNEKNRPNITDPTDPNSNLNQAENFNYNYYPNPVITDLNIEYLLKENSEVTITLYDMTGRITTTIPKIHQQEGLYTETIDCSTLSKGSYILQITVNQESVNQKINKK